MLKPTHHSFLHQNNSPANHVARFVSRATYCVLLRAGNLNVYAIDRHSCKFLIQDDLYQFLVSWACVAGISKILQKPR